MTTSFYNGVAGMKSFQYGIDVWGNNISNINTTGYKEQLPEFSTLLSNTILQTPAVSADIGYGSALSSTAIDLSQGSLVSTDNPFDLSIQGDGWFGVQNQDNQYFTRTGSFSRDANGYLVDDNGSYLLVANANNLIPNDDGTYYVDSTIDTQNLVQNAQSFSPISLPNNVILPAVPTSNINLQTNLNDDSHITTTSYANVNSDFSALYSKDGDDLQIRNSDSLVFGFGNNVTYDNNLLSTEICINPDIEDGEDVNFDFTVNGQEINLTLPDGSTKEEIQAALSEALNNAGIMNSITDKGITISDPNKIIITSNNDLIPNTAAAKITYTQDPQNEYDFTTINDFNNILQNLVDTVYPGAATVSVDDEGRITIDNTSLNTINAYLDQTDNSNSAFLTNLGRLGNQIFPQTAAKSYGFLTNTQSFGGDLYEANGNKDTISFSFTKYSVQNNQIIWQGDITITDPDGNEIANTSSFFTFNADGMLIDPKTIQITTPQNITLNFDLTSFQKPDNALTYSYTQDGVAEGYLNQYQIDNEGNIQAIFSNGQMSILGQIPVFHFQNDQGLESVGGNLFTTTANSNEPLIFRDANGNYIQGASIVSNTLETSNVNFSQAMTELIITQKAFSSAAKAVTTSDQMIQRAIDMKKG